MCLRTKGNLSMYFNNIYKNASGEEMNVVMDISRVVGHGCSCEMDVTPAACRLVIWGVAWSYVRAASFHCNVIFLYQG